MTDTNEPSTPTTPPTGTARPRHAEDDGLHGPGGMDGIEDEPVRAPDDDDAPGGMTGIPDPDAD